MKKGPIERITVVCDTCIIINFLQVERVDLLYDQPNNKIVITEHTRAEITDRPQKKKLEKIIEDGKIEEIEVVNPDELATFAKLTRVLGRGESAALSLAQHRGRMIATDETGRVFKEVESRLGKGKLINTPGFILKAIKAGLLTVSEADKIKVELEAHRFRMRFKSFQELL
ncbi:hypothetical protein L0222_32425 [bacterium]|nr:hypothetical protein [bacterium]